MRYRERCAKRSSEDSWTMSWRWRGGSRRSPSITGGPDGGQSVVLQARLGPFQTPAQSEWILGQFVYCPHGPATPPCLLRTLPTARTIHFQELGMKRLVLEDSWAAKRMKTIRFSLIGLPGRVVNHARWIIIRLVKNHPSMQPLANARQRIMAYPSK